MTTTLLAYIPSPARGVWYLGPFPIRAYALFIIVGIVVALLIGDRRWEARGGERGVIYDISLWAVPFGLLGGRLYHVMTDWPKYFGDGGAGIIGAVRIWDGGLGIWGAVALGGVGAWIACRRRGIPLPAFGDAIAPGIVLAQAIGRLGNYFNQELYGRPTTVPWGLEIYERKNANGVVSPDLANGVSTGQLDSIVHPTFLYELLWNVLIFAVLIWVDRKFTIGHGRLFALYVAGYCLGRFWVELLRSDQATLIADIRVNSFTSTFVFIGAVVYIMVAPKGREDPSTLKGWAVDDDSLETVLAKEMTAVGATTGVVAAAKVAGEAEAEDATAVGDESPPEDAPKSVAAAEAEQLTADIAELPDEDIVEGEKFAAKIAAADADVTDAEVTDADAGEGEAEKLGADVAGVPADSVAEAEKFAAEGEEPEPVGGVGAVEGDEVVEAEEAAPEVHEAAVEGVAEAEELAADAAADAEAADTEADESGAEAEPVGGLGAVEGDEVVEAEEAAPEVHEAAVEGVAEAEELAADAAADAEAADTEAEAAVEDEPQAEAAEEAADTEAEPQAEESVAEAEPVGGLGAVEGDEVVEAEVAAPEVHEAAVEGAAEAEEIAADAAEDAEAADTHAEESVAEAEPVGGLGAVEGDEVVEAEVAAPEVHEAAVEGAADAEELAADTAGAKDADEAQPEDEALEAEPQAEKSDTDEASESVGSAEADEAAPEVHEPAAAAAEEAEEVSTEVSDDAETPAVEQPVDEADAADVTEAEPESERTKVVQIPPTAPKEAPADVAGGPIRRWLRRRNR